MKFDIDLGKVGISLCGAWDIATDYERLSAVTYNGSSYVSRKANRGVVPEDNPDTWMLMAKKGDKGKKGDTGGEGLDGLDGLDGTSTIGTGGDSIGLAYYTDGKLYWTKNGKWLLDPAGNMVPVYASGSGSDGGSGSTTPSTDTSGTAAAFKEFVFKRASTQPATPTGGTYDSPVPSGWSDGIPAGDAPLWMSARWFYSDAKLTAATTWSAPSQMTDTSSIDIEYSSVENPGTPATNPSAWHNDGNQYDIWMAIRIKQNDAWGAWSVMMIKGEKGQDGTSIRIKGTLSSTSQLPQTGNEIGDCYIINGELWVWDGTTWQNMGTFKGDPGMSIQLSKSSGVFKGGLTSAADNQGDTIYVLSYLGSLRAVTTVGNITGAVTGITATVQDNGTDHTSIVIAVTSALTTERGTLSIPVVSNGQSVVLEYTWVLALQSGVIKGDDGYSRAVVAMYQRTINGAPQQSPGAGTFAFATGNLALESPGDWEDAIPSGTDPIYVTYAYPMSNGATAELTAGWNTSGGSWTPPVRLTGDNGLRGKVMRGINEFSSNGLLTTAPSGNTFDINRDYQGLEDTETSHIFYDVVYRVINGQRKYFYCKTALYNGTPARNFTPGTNAAVWVEATNFDFIATKVLLANKAFIDILSGNGVYMYADDQRTVVAGMQGGNGLMFFAGATKEGAESAPFRVYADGRLYAAEGIFAGAIRMPFSSIFGSASDPYILSNADCYLKVEYQDGQSFSNRQVCATLPEPSTSYSGHVYNILIPAQSKLLLTDGDQMTGLRLVSPTNKLYNYFMPQGQVGVALSSIFVSGGFLQVVCTGTEWVILHHPEYIVENQAGGAVVNKKVLGGNSMGGDKTIGTTRYTEDNNTIVFGEQYTESAEL